MPIYEYRCEDCGAITEILQKRIDPEEVIKCSKCGSTSLKKIISAPAIVIKGTRAKGQTCCGRTERCDTPPCSTDGTCTRDS